MAAELTLELIAHGPQQVAILPIAAHVQKYTDRFIYTDRIDETSVPIAYYESDPLYSWRNIQLLDRTHLISANTFDFVAPKDSWTEVTSTSFTSMYKEVAVTHKTIIDRKGRQRPVFFRHDLPADTVEANIHVIKNGVQKDIEGGYLADVENDVIYTNYRNSYNHDNGSYRIYFITSIDSSGNSTHQLLSSEPVAREASWEDVDLTTGKLKEEVPLFSRSKSSSGYTFYMNIAQTYYIRPLEESLIKPEMPAGVDPEDPWNIRFMAGEFATYVNGRFRRYWLPEYQSQPYQPYYPYIYSPYRKMFWVNRNIIRATRNHLSIDPTADMHLTIFIYDEDDVLKNLYTTDVDLDGVRYSDTGADNVVYYESDKITSWDNSRGFIALGVEVDPNWNFYATYYYKAKDYEFTGRSLNPLQDKNVLNYMWVYYMVPDADNNDKAIHLLSVDRSGIIASTTQVMGRTYPNHTLFNTDGTANADTVIGMKYRSAVDTNTFTNKYTAQWDNAYGYYILAEVLVMDTGIKEESFIVDVRRDGATFTKDGFVEAVEANPRILQSEHGYGDLGQEVPDSGSYVIHYPVSLLETYGGNLTRNQTEKLLKEYLPVYTFPLLNQDYPLSLVEGISTTVEQVDFKVSWEGPKYSYSIYKKESAGAEWVFLKSIPAKSGADAGAFPNEGPIWISEVDTDVQSGSIYYYTIRIQEGLIEYPGSDTLSVKVA